MDRLQMIRVDARVIAILLLALASPSIAADPSPPGEFPKTLPEKKQIIIEHIYNYQMMEYRPRVRVPILSNEQAASYDNPESTVIAHVSAMSAKDWEWFLKSWTKTSVKEFEERLRGSGVTPEALVEKWARVKWSQAEIVSRINTGEYVIIFYEVGNQNGKLFAVMKREDAKWLLTNELRDDPGLAAGTKVQFGPDGKAVIKKVVR